MDWLLALLLKPFIALLIIGGLVLPLELAILRIISPDTARFLRRPISPGIWALVVALVLLVAGAIAAR